MPRRRLLLILLAALVVIGAAIGIALWSQQNAITTVDRSARSAVAEHRQLLASELQKFRLLPIVIAELPDVATVLSGGRDDGRANRTLELLARRTDAAAIYAIDRTGRTVAANNWRQRGSFVGQRYEFRPYFVDAMQSGRAELFALGTVSRRPGLYLSRRIDRDGRPLGVIVVKVEFDALERSWARSPGVTLATDSHGVVLVTSIPGWRFRATHAPDAATLASARRTLQFGAAPLALAPVTLRDTEATVGRGAGASRYRVARLPSPLANGEVIRLAPAAPALRAAWGQGLLAAALLAIAAIIAGGLVVRGADRRRLQREARIALESEVAARTSELRDSNARLQVESAERIEVDRRYRAAREELAQANRLGSIGQITAGVAHEINQPLAAIRTFAENGAAFLDRGTPAAARDNLARIVALTDRMAAITAELRAFARRKHNAPGAVQVGAILDGLLLLIGERARESLTLDADPDVRAIDVIGDRIRLEQILVNLVQNALDAIRGVPDGRIILSAARAGSGVELRVADTGAGIDPAIRDTLFTPFTTGKDGGLGLGLAIARDIAREFGGELSALDAPGGAVFVLTLRRS